jgi:hypothetical protein
VFRSNKADDAPDHSATEELILDSDALLSFKPESPVGRTSDAIDPDDHDVANQLESAATVEAGTAHPADPPEHRSEGSVVIAARAADFAETGADLEHQLTRLDILKQALDETALKLTGADAALEQIERRTADAKAALNDCVTQLEARVAAIAHLVDLAVDTDRALSNVEARLIALAGSRTLLDQPVSDDGPTRDRANTQSLLAGKMTRVRGAFANALGRLPRALNKRTTIGVVGAAGLILMLATMMRHVAGPTASAAARSVVGSSASGAASDSGGRAAEDDGTKPFPGSSAQEVDPSTLTASPKRQAPGRNAGGRLFTGSVRIDSVPESAAVFVNQQRVGRTPLRVNAVRAGSTVIRIERDGFKRWSRAVRVVAHEQTNVRAVLETDPAP